MTEKQKELIELSKQQLFESLKRVSDENQNNHRAFCDMAKVAINSSLLLTGGSMACLLYNAKTLPEGWLAVFGVCALSAWFSLLSAVLATASLWFYAKEYDKSASASLSFCSRFLVSLVLEHPAGHPDSPHQLHTATILAHGAAFSLALSLVLSLRALFIFIDLF